MGAAAVSPPTSAPRSARSPIVPVSSPVRPATATSRLPPTVLPSRFDVDLSSLPLAYRLSRPAPFHAAGKTYPLLFTHAALLRAEAASGIDTLSISLTAPSSSLLRALLYGALAAVGCPLTPPQVGSLFSPRALRLITEAVLQAWGESMPKREPAQDASGDGGREFDSESGSPSSSLPLTWLRAWAYAHEVLRLSESEWLDMTPLQIQELRAAHVETMQREELMMGMVLATIENFSPHPPKKASTPDSFMFHKFPKKPAQPVTGEYIMAQLRQQGWAKANPALKEQEHASRVILASRNEW